MMPLYVRCYAAAADTDAVLLPCFLHAAVTCRRCRHFAAAAAMIRLHAAAPLFLRQRDELAATRQLRRAARC